MLLLACVVVVCWIGSVVVVMFGSCFELSWLVSTLGVWERAAYRLYSLLGSDSSQPQYATLALARNLAPALNFTPTRPPVIARYLILTAAPTLDLALALTQTLR